MSLLSLLHRPWFVETAAVAAAATAAVASATASTSSASGSGASPATAALAALTSASAAINSLLTKLGAPPQLAVASPTSLTAAAAVAYLLLPAHVTLLRVWNLPFTKYQKQAVLLPDVRIPWDEATKPCGPATGERYVVVGGAGFVGKRIVHALLLRGETRVAVVDLDRAGLALLQRDYPSVEIHAVNVTDVDTLTKVLRGATAVFSPFAAIRFWESLPWHYVRSERINVKGSACLIQACRNAGVKRLITTSTGNVTLAWPAWRRVACDESEPTVTPSTALSHYASSKAAAERLVLAANSPELATGVIRPCSNVYGYQDKLWIQMFVEAGMSFVADPQTPSDFVFVDSIVLAHLLLEARLRNGHQDAAAGEAFNITGGGVIPDGAFVALCDQESERVRGKRLPPAGFPVRLMSILGLIIDVLQIVYPGDLTRVLGPNLGTLTTTTLCAATARNPCKDDKAKRILGYRVHLSPRLALRRTFKEYQLGKIIID